jgi:hypothetical protein
MLHSMMRASHARSRYLLRRNRARQRDGRSCGVDGALGYVSSRISCEGNMAGFAGYMHRWQREEAIRNGYGRFSLKAHA